jgi:Zn-dependent protease
MNDIPEPREVQPHSPPRPRPSSPLIQGGSLRLFSVGGIDVLVHWSWLIVAWWRIQSRASSDDAGLATYTSSVWYVIEYVALFGIVLLHEFGHVLACRSVGGRANRIILWPLGGVALVQPPPRPGAFLWSLAAGPLVNVLLLPVTIGLWYVAHVAGWHDSFPDLYQFVTAIAIINGMLLAFNLLPIYPLDGGQMLQALLWFVIGRAQSLLVATVIGLIAGLGLLVLALLGGALWLALMAGFALLFSFLGLRNALAQLRYMNAPRRKGMACPVCGAPPPKGAFWRCSECRAPFDIFAAGGVCPRCEADHPTVPCSRCGRQRPYDEWFPQVLAVEPTEPSAPPGEPGTTATQE